MLKVGASWNTDYYNYDIDKHNTREQDNYKWFSLDKKHPLCKQLGKIGIDKTGKNVIIHDADIYAEKKLNNMRHFIRQQLTLISKKL